MKKTGLLFLLGYFFCFSASAEEIQLKSQSKNICSVKENTYQSLRVREKLGQLQQFVVKTEMGLFNELRVDGYSFTTGIGSPKLPVNRKLIEVPQGAEIKIVLEVTTYTEYTLAELGMEHSILPLQQPVPKNDSKLPPFEFNKKAYANNSFSPNDLVTVDQLGTFRGISLARLNVFPIQYNPVTKKVRIYDDIDVRIVFQHPDVNKTLQMKKMNENPYFSGINNMILNYKPLPQQAKDTITKYPVKYVIVSSPLFQTSLQPFVEWKQQKGFTVVQAYTNDPNVGTTANSIKNYLEGLYLSATAEDPAPSFILLVGDNAQIPSFTGTSGGHKSDMYFAEYTNDDFPEVYIGRFSAENEAQLAPQINKTIEYEKYLMPDPSFLDQVVMIAGVDGTFGPTHANGQINYGTTYYFNAAHGITSHTYLYPQSGSSASQIIQDVSNGVGFANYTAHGSSSGWADPSFSVSDVDGLQNTHKYPLMIGNCCLTNKFDDPVCFGEALLRANNKGALGYIGGSNVTYWDEDFYYGVGVRNISANPVWTANAQPGAYDLNFHENGLTFPDWYMTQAQINYAGNMAVTVGTPSSTTYYWEVYHLMGDPSLMPYLSVPPPMTVSFNGLIQLGATSFTVNAEPYTYVAISQGNILYGAALADASGVAVVSLNPITTPGYAQIVITGQNWQPYFGSVMVASPTGPYVLLEQYQANEVVGNNNNQIDFNETISLNVTLKNWGQAVATNVNATLSSNDAYITITDNSQTWGNISIGAISTQTNAFTFQVADDIPDQHQPMFTITVHDNSGSSWTSDFKLTVNAPHFVVTNLNIDDATGGNGNGRLDPGETVNLLITTINDGHSAAPSTLGSISSSSPLVTLNNTTNPMNTVNPGSPAIATFNAVIGSSATVGDYIPLSYQVASGAYNAAKNFNPAVGLILEDWESGTTSQFYWVTNGSAPWAITTENPYEGAYCLKSGAIGNQQHSDLLITGTVLNEDSLSFYYKVSSEQDYDFLQFYVDAVKKGEWSGEQGWLRAVYLVSPGVHTFKWIYAKDYSQTNGSDRAWVDFIAFPPTDGIINSIFEPGQDEMQLSVYPNPTQSECQLNLTLAGNEKVEVKLLNPLGQVSRLVIPSQNLPAGTHTIKLDVRSLASGIYLLQVSTGKSQLVKKLVVR